MTIHTHDRDPSLQSAAELLDLVYDSEIYQQCAPKLQKMLVGLLESCPTEAKHHSLGYLQLRLKSGLALADAVDACVDAGDINPEHIRFATFCFRDGYTDLDAPLPDLDTQAGRIDRLCRRFGLSALIIPDIEVVRLPGYTYPLLSYHHHALVWTSDGSIIKPTTLSKAMNARLKDQTLILPPVMISKKLAGQTAIDRVREIAGYATKVTSRLKRVSYNALGEFHSRSSRADFTMEQAVRMLHAWSLLKLYESVKGVGQGKAIRKAWKASFTEQLSRRGNSPFSPVRTPLPNPARWEEVWAKNRVRAYGDKRLAEPADKFDLIKAAAEAAQQKRDSVAAGGLSSIMV
jgi:hypothetical protein